MIQVSPRHRIEVNDALRHMLEDPPDRDYVVRTISQKTVNQQPLIQGELIISGQETIDEYPLAKEFPLHFRKTYYPICFHQNPEKEYENQLAASGVIDVPAPIGSTRTSFRSCYIPGRPYSSLTPFGVEPLERNIAIGETADPAAMMGLWSLLDSLYPQVQRLHEEGLVHGDLFLHNVIVSFSPVAANLIDFELAIRKSETTDEEKWAQKEFDDLREILREAAYLQCALGRQEGALADAVRAHLPELFDKPDRFADAMEHSGIRHG